MSALTDYKGYKILTAYNVQSHKWTVKWGIPGSDNEFTSRDWNSPFDAAEFAKIRIDRDTALTVHKPQRREDDTGDILWAS